MSFDPEKKRLIRVLIVNAYSVLNRGDFGIVVAMCKLIREAFPEAAIECMSVHWEVNQPELAKRDVKTIPPMWSYHSRAGAIGRYLGMFTGLLKAALRIGSNSSPYHQCDVVLGTGGGYLYSSRKGPFGFGLCSALGHLWLGSKFGKPTILFPQSVGPLKSNLDKAITKIALSGLTRVLSRESASTALAAQVGLTNVAECPDVALTLNPEAPPESLCLACPEHAKDRPTLGITVLDWRFAKTGSNESDVEAYVHKLSIVVQRFLADNPHGVVRIFPQVSIPTGTLADNDLPISKNLASRFSDRVSVVDVSMLQPEQIVGVYARTSVFIASRMHSAIFAICGCVPVVAMAYQPKTRGTVALFQHESTIFEVDRFDENDVYEQIQIALNSRDELAEEIRRRLEVVRSRIRHDCLSDLKRILGGETR